ncbi:MAG: CaiB/BaiF CoA-transferase family protein [Halobacteria archaeon]
MAAALDGVKVLDLTVLLPGPWCTQMLGDLGADVVKIEQQRTGDTVRWAPPAVRKPPAKEGAAFLLLNRNKRSVTLNLKDPKGRDLFLEMAKKADVVVEGFRPGVVDRLGIGWEAVKKVNPRAVYCSISGYGQDGPYREWPGHDLNYVGVAGGLGLGAGPKPEVIPLQIADIGGGGSMAVMSILAALVARQKTGCGQCIDISMADGAASWLTLAAAAAIAENRNPTPRERVLSGRYPCYRIYEAADGKFVTLAALEPHFWENFCKAVNKPEWKGYHMAPDDSLAKANAEVEALFRTKPRDEWVKFLNGQDVPAGPASTIPEMFNDPQMLHRKMVVEMEHPKLGKIKVLGSPLKLSDTPPVFRRAAPGLGEHTEEVLKEWLGLDAGKVAELKKGGVV